ncbi:hypothetical protein AVMA1855_06650 [Acidovorax sp. SUPP1855]|uniref:hypothetical protein n=1 Tax=Acidovorax sp. SUPP1855 TaxID=431774 RepID=UPI0023DE2F93|nr:hypothetical protein [Acidovorax sp. SUPP1855]GKS83804.1 hypothetical protein AVMA1855_06650 [Acidovorax sp. SUPP1855]
MLPRETINLLSRVQFGLPFAHRAGHFHKTSFAPEPERNLRALVPLSSARWTFILMCLAMMARACPEYGDRPVVPALGMLDLAALLAREFVSPARAQMMRKAA